MVARLRSWWQKRRTPLIGVAITVLVVGVLALLTFGYLLRWAWTGFLTKTLWDWLQLLIIPVVLAVAGFWLNQIQKSREEKITERRAKSEQETTLNNQREAALQGYIDTMSELLLEKHLGELTPEGKVKPEYEEVRKIARVRTLTVLQQLDAIRKFSVLLFLHESRLIDKGDKCIVTLDIANLQRADLQGIHLENAQLCGAKLQEANLSGADLSGADLKDVNLQRANLTGVDLREAYLKGVDLGGADLSGALLDRADLEKQAKSLKGAIMPDGSKHP
ncbi:MAG TPA: pentapeptide repeat-containing protein [Ktedonobacteraceae bacterium]|nr:pentapeptide repeat-containing protein [Ktedonobacteraceae bacterium]